MELVERMLGGDRQSLARLISLVEREAPEGPEIMRQVYPRVGKAYSIGITGPPGGGKSTLVDRLTSLMRGKGLAVGIIAADPTSPFSGGAVLGDRVRMQQHYLDNGVFIRSMATRGSQGGLPRTARGVMRLFDAFGKDIILVETVGVGQTELDIIGSVDTVVVVLVPEGGDVIQTLKAGLLEIADIFVVNKADRPGAEYLVAELEAMLCQSPKLSWWEVPAITTQALNNIGIEELYQEIEKHWQAVEKSGQLNLKRRERRRKELIETVEQKIAARLWKLIEEDGYFSRYLDRVEEGEIDPYSACEEILSDQNLIQAWLKGLEREV